LGSFAFSKTAGMKILQGRAVVDKLAISGTHWLVPNVGRLAKDGNAYVFSPEPGV
jgi:hypothetical protein